MREREHTASAGGEEGGGVHQDAVFCLVSITHEQFEGLTKVHIHVRMQTCKRIEY